MGEKPKGYDLAAYVLGHFHGEDLELMEEGYEKAISATEEILKGEIDAAMNEYNRKVLSLIHIFFAGRNTECISAIRSWRCSVFNTCICRISSLSWNMGFAGLFS